VGFGGNTGGERARAEHGGGVEKMTSAHVHGDKVG
jgi:hypothetical protein